MKRKNSKQRSPGNKKTGQQPNKSARAIGRENLSLQNVTRSSNSQLQSTAAHSTAGESSEFVMGVVCESESRSEYAIEVPYESSGGGLTVPSATETKSNSDWIPCIALEPMSEEATSDHVVGFQAIVDIDGPPIRSSKRASEKSTKGMKNKEVSVLAHEFESLDVYNGYYTSDDGETYHNRHHRIRKATRRSQRVHVDSRAPKLLSKQPIVSDSSAYDIEGGSLPAYAPSKLHSLSDIDVALPANHIFVHQSSDSREEGVEEGKCGSSDEGLQQKVCL
jgi:hypothetical protein